MPPIIILRCRGNAFTELLPVNDKAQTLMVPIICVDYKAPYREVTSTVYDFVNDCNHGYTLGATFCSRMRLCLSGMVLPAQGIRTLEHMQIHMR
jgi:hypothetical protein